MTGDMALKLASEGKKVRRDVWHGKDYVTCENSKFQIYFYGAVPFEFHLDPTDLNATDWSVYGRES